MKKRPEPALKSLDTALVILGCFSLRQPSWSIADLGRQLGLYPSRVFRAVKTLEKHDFLEREPNTKKYRLGVRFFALGKVYEAGMDLVAIARPHLEELSRITAGTISLRIHRAGEQILLDKVDSKDFLIVHYPVGITLPCNHGSAGKLLLAYLSPEERGQLIKDGKIARFTPNTIVEPRKLEKHLEAIRRQGYAFSDQETIEGARGIAVPVRDHRGQVVAALGVSLPAFKLPKTGIEEVVAAARKAADEISLKLGWDGSS